MFKGKYTHEIGFGDIVQISPDADDRFGGCLAIVQEAKSWGVQCVVKVPGKGDAYYRVNFDNCTYVGQAYWVPSDLFKDDSLEPREEIEPRNPGDKNDLQPESDPLYRQQMKDAGRGDQLP